MQKKEDIYTVHKKFYTRKPKKRFFCTRGCEKHTKSFFAFNQTCSLCHGWRVTMGYMARPAITQPTAQVA